MQKETFIETYGRWMLHTAFLIGQSFLAYKAQTNPHWAWIMPPLSIAQTTFPSPLSKEKTNGKISIP